MSLVKPKHPILLAQVPSGQEDKHSISLYKWFVKHMKNESGRVGLWRHKISKRIYIGFLLDDNLVGGNLKSVLDNSAAWRARKIPDSYSFGGPSSAWTDVSYLWKRYCQNGRCFLDPAHTYYSTHLRWKTNQKGTRRTCLWCGRIEERKITLVTHRMKTWAVLKPKKT